VTELWVERHYDRPRGGRLRWNLCKDLRNGDGRVVQEFKTREAAQRIKERLESEEALTAAGLPPEHPLGEPRRWFRRISSSPGSTLTTVVLRRFRAF
jgi:hypothetical protein